MSNTKQSSVEQFWDQLEEKSWENASMNRIEISISVEEYLALKEQAKAMHKEEIVKACNLQRNDYKGMPTFNKSGEEYYNETFGGNK